MQYLEFEDYKIPLVCVTGFSYNKSGNLVQRAARKYVCTGINNIQVQLQMSINVQMYAELARELAFVHPHKTNPPSTLKVAGQTVLPQLQFLLTSTNVTYQSDRLGNLQSIELSWTLSGSRVVKNENREVVLYNTKKDGIELLPRVTLHCKNKTLELKNNISICRLNLTGFNGELQVMLSDTYTSIDRQVWFIIPNQRDDVYFDVENYGKFYITSSHFDDNIISYKLTKFSKKWFKATSKTYQDATLKDIFPVVNKSNIQIYYYLLNDTLYNSLYTLQDSLGFLIGVKGDSITVYDVPEKIKKGSVTYNYITNSDIVTMPISGLTLSTVSSIMTVGTDEQEVMSKACQCVPTDLEATTTQLLKYINFSKNVITMAVPYESKLYVGCLVNVRLKSETLPCICTNYEIDFMTGQMRLELHYL